MPEPHSPRQNRLLAALPAPESERLYPHLELVPLPLSEVLYESGDQLQHVYFPTTSIVSLLYVMADGVPGDRIRHVYFPTDSFIFLVAPIDGYAGLEVGMSGSEGMFGIGLMLGVDVSPLHASGCHRPIRAAVIVSAFSWDAMDPKETS